MLVLRGFQTNSGLRGEMEPERVPQVGEKRSAASGDWGAVGRASVPQRHCLRGFQERGCPLTGRPEQGHSLGQQMRVWEQTVWVEAAMLARTGSVL